MVAVLLVAVSAVGLGRWQLRRLHDRRASNAALSAAGQLPPLALPAGLPGSGTIDSGRRIVATGHFEPADQLILRGHVQDDAPGVQIVTPFVFDTGSAVLWVLRGFVRSPDAVTPPDTIRAPDTGAVTIEGLAYAIPVTKDSGAPLLHHGVTTWKRLDRAVVTARRPGSLAVYLILAGDSAGAGRLATVAPPQLSDGPHLSYALQWFGIALAVLTFGGVVLWRDGRGSPQRPEAP
jgi:surfeit locus 1 family protein